MNNITLSRQETARIAQLLEELDAALASDSEAAAWAERRLRPRIDFAHPMSIRLSLEEGQPWIEVFSRNLSTGGLAFLAKQPFAKDSFLILAHHLNEGADQLALCRITFCRPIESAYYEIGVTFEAIVPDENSRRIIPSEWHSKVLRTTWVTRDARTS
jgi:hypothetical protein